MTEEYLFHFNTKTDANMKIVIPAFIVFILSAIPAWITHVVVCIKTASWIFLLAGAICAPIGVIHGYGVWFGWF